MLRNLKLLLPVLLVFWGIWYFFLKEYDYKIRFKVETSQGHIYQKLNNWKYDKPAPPEVVSRSPFEEIRQTSDSLNLDWKIKAVNDTLSKVSVGLKHKEDNLKKRLQLLFRNPLFQKEIKEKIQRFKDALEADKKLLKFSIGKKEHVKSTTCGCISLESKPEEKGLKMMTNIDMLSNYILNNNLKMDGQPRVHITRWDIENNYINFDFCFPLKGDKDFPQTASIFIKDLPVYEAIQGQFQGNYVFSYYFWPDVLKLSSGNYQKDHLEILEIFNDNPEMGGNASQWKAELYLIGK